LIDEVVSLPIEERALVVDSILRSLHQHSTELDKKWQKEACKRFLEIRQKKVEAISGEDVFGKITQKFNK
jgi:putative addiction module component (TIGR02574 family)